jgi:hypothetical protein
LVRYFWKKNNSDEKKTFPKIKKEAILSIPIKSIKTTEEKTIQDEIIKNVTGILKLHEELKTAKLPEKLEQIKNRIEHTNNRINQLIYNLYDLTSIEIELIEKGI